MSETAESTAPVEETPKATPETGAAPETAAQAEPVVDTLSALNETWGKNWRDITAGSDNTFRKELDRYSSYGDYVTASKEARRALTDSGRIKIPKADATPEEVAKFREHARGTLLEVPETPDGYGEIVPSLPEGVQLPQEATPVMQAAMLAGHKAGFTKAQMQATQDFVAQLFVDSEKEQEINLQTGANRARQELEKVWPGEVEQNLTFANQAARHFCKAVGVDPGDMASIRLANGSTLGNHPLYARVMANIGRGLQEDPAFMPEVQATHSVEAMMEEKRKIMALRNGTQREKNEYDSPTTQSRLDQINAALGRVQRAR